LTSISGFAIFSFKSDLRKMFLRPVRLQHDVSHAPIIQREALEINYLQGLPEIFRCFSPFAFSAVLSATRRPCLARLPGAVLLYAYNYSRQTGQEAVRMKRYIEV
jgi:hypothetical protein